MDQAIAWLATATGFTPVEAVRWATMAPADSVGWSELGRFVPGVAADLDQLRPTAGPAAATFIAGWLAWDRDPGGWAAWQTTPT